jgi:hypothetical protein
LSLLAQGRLYDGTTPSHRRVAPRIEQRCANGARCPPGRALLLISTVAGVDSVPIAASDPAMRRGADAISPESKAARSPREAMVGALATAAGAGWLDDGRRRHESPGHLDANAARLGVMMPNRSRE